MEMIIVIALLIVIAVFAGIKLRIEYENDDRLRSILGRLNENENGLEDINMWTEKYEYQRERIDRLEKNIANINMRTEKYENQYERILFFVNSLENVKVNKPPPPDSFFRKPSESSPRK